MCLNCMISRTNAAKEACAAKYPWHGALAERHSIHRAALEAALEWTNAGGHTSEEIEAAFLRIAMEIPHVAQMDPNKIAYLRNANDGGNRRWTVAKMGGYINRMFPGLPGHVVETLVARHRTGESTYELLPGSQAVTVMMTTTACSCMTKGGWSEANHPYRVFENDEHGWKIAVRKENDVPVARALVNDGCFVRIYGTPLNNEYSRADDPALRNWLESQGFRQSYTWAGCDLKAVYYQGKLLGPYIDGTCCGTEWIDNETLRLSPDGHVYMHDTSGFAEDSEAEHEGQIELENGDWVDEDDAVYIDDYYDDGYYHVDDCTLVGDDWHRSIHCVGLYDGTDGFKRECVRLANGDWADSEDENIVYCEYDGNYYHIDDVVYDYNDEAIPADYAVELHDGSWAANDDENIVQLWNDEYAMRDDAVKTTSGAYAFPEDVLERDGELFVRAWIEEIEVLPEAM